MHPPYLTLASSYFSMPSTLASSTFNPLLATLFLLALLLPGASADSYDDDFSNNNGSSFCIYGPGCNCVGGKFGEVCSLVVIIPLLIVGFLVCCCCFAGVGVVGLCTNSEPTRARIVFRNAPQGAGIYGGGGGAGANIV